MNRALDLITHGLVVPETERGVRRYLGTPELGQIDPVVLLDWFESEGARVAPGFAPHPHRGIETLTLMLEGGMEHFDNCGHTASVGAGGAQLMRAGRGLLHAERPVPDGGRVFGLQMWFNLSRADKALAPDYQPLPAEVVPVVAREGARVRVVMGCSAEGARSPARPRATAPVVLDVTLRAGGAFSEPIAAGRTGFVIVVGGEISCAGRSLSRGALGRLGPGDGLALSSRGGGRAIIVSALPIGEPVVRSGPFVMTSRAEILAAYDDYREGGFGPRIALPPAIS